MLDVAAQITPPPIEPVAWEPFPDIDLRQLLRLTDDTGMFQHALYGMPDPNHGYCIDDNARALIAALLHAQLRGYDERVVPAHRYLTFLAYAFNDQTRSFRNFMGYDRRWLEEAGSHDSQGRTIWALGVAMAMAPRGGIQDLARNLIHKGLPAVEALGHIRSWAFSLIGLDHLLRVEPDDYARELRDRFAERLFQARQAHATADWPWWEDIVTYDNAKLCHALLLSGAAMGRPDMVEAALQSLRWLLEVQTSNDGEPHLSIIGNDGWLRRDGQRAQFDQQPLEAYAMVDACLGAARVTGDQGWAHHAWRCFEWFRGRNDLKVSLYDADTGGCQDGLQPDGANQNQGAESSLAYLLSVLELHRYREARAGRVSGGSAPALGYAIVGVSKFAEFCLEQFDDIETLKPVGAWNRTTSKAKALSEKTGIKAYEEFQQLLQDPQVDLVHIATTPDTHAELALAALTAGKHVLCEKPLAIDVVDAERMIQTAATRDLALGVNFMMRYGPLVTPLKRIIDKELLGAPLRGYFVNRAGDAGLPADHWFWDETRSGGILVEHGVHMFDLVRHWLGDGSVVSAQRFRRPDSQVIDQVTCDVRFPGSNGGGVTQTSVNFYHGFLQPVPLDTQEFRLIFERGDIRVRGWIASSITLHGVMTDAEVERLRALLPDAQVETVQRFEGDEGTFNHRGHETPLDQEVRLTWKDPEDKQRIYGRSLRALMEDLLESIRDRRHQPRVTAADGAASLRLATEATRLAATVTV